MTTPEPRSIRNGTPNRGYLAGGRRWTGRDGRSDTRGENGRGAKLTDAAVLAILAVPRTGPDKRSDAAVAAEHGVSKATVNRIRSGSAWGHLRGDEDVDGEAS